MVLGKTSGRKVWERLVYGEVGENDWKYSSLSSKEVAK